MKLFQIQDLDGNDPKEGKPRKRRSEPREEVIKKKKEIKQGRVYARIFIGPIFISQNFHLNFRRNNKL